MIDQGVDGICILANYSEQFLLSDDERDTLMDVCLTHVAGRVPVIVTCSHFSTRIAAGRASKAAAAGAAMLMLMPPYHGAGLRADEKTIIEHFARIADAAAIPIMVQDAPLSGVTLTVPFLVRLARREGRDDGGRRNPQRRCASSARAAASCHARRIAGTRAGGRSARAALGKVTGRQAYQSSALMKGPDEE